MQKQGNKPSIATLNEQVAELALTMKQNDEKRKASKKNNANADKSKEQKPQKAKVNAADEVLKNKASQDKNSASKNNNQKKEDSPKTPSWVDTVSEDIIPEQVEKPSEAPEKIEIKDSADADIEMLEAFINKKVEELEKEPPEPDRNASIKESSARKNPKNQDIKVPKNIGTEITEAELEDLKKKAGPRATLIIKTRTVGRNAVDDIPKVKNPEISYVLIRRDTGEIFDLKKITTIGKNGAADIRIDEKYVSRRHAKITISGNNVVITDLDSTNGTFVNGEKIRQDKTLKIGDKLRFADIKFELAEK